MHYHMRFKHSFALVFSSLLLISCAEFRHNGTSSIPFHATGEPVPALKNNSMWAVVSREQYVRILRKQEDDLYPSTSPEHFKCEQIVAKLDAAARSKFPSLLANIPVPQVIVQKRFKANASVSYAKRCFNGNIHYSNVTLLNGSMSASLPSYIALWPEGVAVESDESCISTDSGIDKEYLNKFISIFNENATDVTLSFADDTIQIHYKSPVNAYVQRKDYSRFSIPTMMNVITINDGLLKKTRPEALPLIMAHELGHYYKAHGILDSKTDYDYFYFLKDTNSHAKPSADEGALGLGAELLKTYLPEDNPFRATNELPPEFIGSVIHFMDKYILENKLIETSILDICKEASSGLSQIAQWQIAKSSYQNNGDYKTFVPIFTEAEKKLAKCFASLFPEQNGIPNSNIFYSFFTLNTQSSYTPFRVIASENDVNTSTLKESLANVLVAFKKIEENTNSLYKNAEEKRLGFYTQEQEADEIGMELFSGSGYPFKGILEAFMEIADDSPLKTKFSNEKCKALYQNSWLDEKGSKIFVPFGTTRDSHHDMCFRIFNLAREIESHGYLMEK